MNLKKLFIHLNNKKLSPVIIISFISLFFINSCKFNQKIENDGLLNKEYKYKIEHFLVMNEINESTKKFIEQEIKNDNKNILNCNIKENEDAICATNIIDLNHDTIPEIIFENTLAYTRIGEIVILSKINNIWEVYHLVSSGFNIFGHNDAGARTDFYKGNVTSIKPLWNDIKYKDFTLSAEYGGEPPAPIENFNIIEQLFGVFPVYYLPKNKGKFSPNSLQMIAGNKIIPNEIYEQNFEYRAGEVPGCLDAKPTKFVCYAISIDLNEDGKDEILYLDSDRNFKALYKTSQKWEILNYYSPYKWSFSPNIKQIAKNPNLLELERPFFDDIQIGKYSFRPSRFPCNELNESMICK